MIPKKTFIIRLLLEHNNIVVLQVYQQFTFKNLIYYYTIKFNILQQV